MKIWPLLISLFFSTLCYSQGIDNNVRPAFTLKLFVDDSTFYTASMSPTSYVIKDQAIQIFPGEKLFIEADILKDSLVNLKAVPGILNKEKTIVLIFTQEHQDKKHEKMILNIINPFSKSLEYNSRINLMKYKKWVGTDVVPIEHGIMGNETWSDIITTMVLYNFHFKN